ncbi:MAG: hypothetical protein ACYDCK_14185 [Thermoplasmatota archaeon]
MVGWYVATKIMFNVMSITTNIQALVAVMIVLMTIGGVIGWFVTKPLVKGKPYA